MKRSACSILAMLLLVSALSMNCYAIDDKSEIYNTLFFILLIFKYYLQDYFKRQPYLPK